MKNKFFIIFVVLQLISQMKYIFSLQLGDGTDKDKYSPVKIMDEVKYVAAGRYHSLFIKEYNSEVKNYGNCRSN